MAMSGGARFVNRAATDARIAPSARGALSLASGSAHREITLAAGYTLVPGGAAPRLPADLARAGAPVGEASVAAGRAAFVVQFADGSADSARDRIERSGGTIVAPLSGEAYLVRMDDDTRSRVAATAGDPWIAPWEPAYKLSPQVDRAAPASLELTALLFADGDGDAVAASLRALGASAVRVHRSEANLLARFELPGSRVADAAAQAEVAWIEPTEHDSLLNDKVQWVVQTSTPGNRRMWDLGIRGQNQVVMVSDSGIRTNHEMFADAAQDITDFGDYPTNRKIIAYKRSSDDPEISFGDAFAYDYHGTHTTGTVAGNADPTTSGQYDGVAKDARLYFMDLAGTVNTGLHPPDDLNELFLPSYAGNAGGAARLSSNSWGASGLATYTVSSMQVDQFMWTHPDYLIAFANGNNGVIGSVNSPATAKNCLSVGGTGNGDLRKTIYQYTSRGPTSDYRRKPTICAPGDLVTSSVGSTRYAYSTYSGTSMATPSATGAMALMRQYLTEGWYPTGAPVAANAINPSAALLKAMAVNSGDNDIVGYYVPDSHIGWGRLDLDNVLYFPGDARHTLLVDEKDGLLDHQYVEYQVQVTDASQPLSFSLVWTDAPGNPASASQLVNDLDLVVTHGASTYLGNRMFNGSSLTGGLRDSFNVEEGVRIPTPAVGLWTARIDAHRVLQGPQPFALCVTGSVGQGAGSIALERYDYALTDTLRLEVLDANAASPIEVTVSSPTDAWGERVQLTGANGVFRGSVPIGPGTPDPSDGRLAVSSGDVVTATYTDANPVLSVSVKATVYAQTPRITEVHARPLSPTSTLITWTTDLPSDSHVLFGASSSLGSSADSSALTTQHAVLVAGLLSGHDYLYDVVSTSRTGGSTRDDLGSAHRSFTAKSPGQFVVVCPRTSTWLMDAYANAFAALGWSVDFVTGAEADPPLVGNANAGLRRYAAVIWQVDPDAYPPITVPQRAAIDSLLDGGGRLMITGHDIGFGLSDAAAPGYTPASELWLESGLKTRYYYDEYAYNFHLYGTAGDPVSGGYVAGVPYNEIREYATSDQIGPAPNTDGVASVNWLDDGSPQGNCGLRWESNSPKGTPGAGFWSGRTSRLAAMYFEWSGLASPSNANAAARTDILERSVDWLLGRKPPKATFAAPLAGSVVTADFLPILYSFTPDTGRAIASRTLSYSLDAGETWKLLDSKPYADPGIIWDLGAVLGGTPVPNSNQVLLKLVATDDGVPALRGETTLSGTFTLARASGDTRGPVTVAGSVVASPTPLRIGSPATLHATFTDAPFGNAHVTAAEYSIGAAAAAAGSGSAMTLEADSSVAGANADVSAGLSGGTQTLWVRGRDLAGNWGPASSITVAVNAIGVLAVDEAPAIEFMAPARPNPFRGVTAIRFGLARAGNVKMELFDVLGRRVRTLVNGDLEAGAHAATWDGRDDQGRSVRAGVFFLRYIAPSRTYHARIVALN